MSKPKNMTPEEEDEWKLKERERGSKRRSQNKDHIKAISKKSREKNRTKRLLKESQMRAENRAAINQRNRERYHENPDRHRIRTRNYEKSDKGRLSNQKKNAKRTENVTPSYAAHVLRIPIKVIPEDLINAKIELIKANRLLKKLRIADFPESMSKNEIKKAILRVKSAKWYQENKDIINIKQREKRRENRENYNQKQRERRLKNKQNAQESKQPATSP